MISAGLVKSTDVSYLYNCRTKHPIKHRKLFPTVNEIELNLHWPNTNLIEFRNQKILVLKISLLLGLLASRSECLCQHLYESRKAGLVLVSCTRDQVEPILQLKAVVEVAEKS